MKDDLRKIFMIVVMILSSESFFAQTKVIKHIIDRGETLNSIALKYGVSKEKIIELNPRTAKFVYVGMELTIPVVEKDNTTSAQNQKNREAQPLIINNSKRNKGKTLEIETKKEKKTQKKVDKEIKKSTLVYSSKEKSKTRSGNKLAEKIGIDFIPYIYTGYSNFSTSEVTPKSAIGLGLDGAFQFIAEKRIGFIPKNYFMEASMGYSMRGSAAHKMHYINMKLSPFGYRYDIGDWALMGKAGVYMGYPFTKIETSRNSFDTNMDFGFLLGIAADFSSIGVGLSYERGLTDVCSSNLSIKNQCIFFSVSYRLFNLK